MCSSSIERDFLAFPPFIHLRRSALKQTACVCIGLNTACNPYWWCVSIHARGARACNWSQWRARARALNPARLLSRAFFNDVSLILTRAGVTLLDGNARRLASGRNTQRGCSAPVNSDGVGSQRAGSCSCTCTCLHSCVGVDEWVVSGGGCQQRFDDENFRPGAEETAGLQWTHVGTLRRASAGEAWRRSTAKCRGDNQARCA
jgi:hypothetical protein